jgi:hypothetical protein
VLGCQFQHDRIRAALMAFDGVLRDDLVLVLDLHRHGIVRQDRSGLLEDLRRLLRFDAVVEVLAHPHLQLAGHRLARHPAAIDEVLLHTSDLGHVKGHGHRRPVRELQSEMLAAFLAQEGFEFVQFHGVGDDRVVVLASPRDGRGLSFVKDVGTGQQLPSRSDRRLVARLASALSVASPAGWTSKNSARLRNRGR